MRIVAIVAARMGSNRLPGKTLKPILERPMLEWLMLRLGKCRLLDDIVIATSDQPQDQVIEDFSREREYHCFRGSENDVLGRYYFAAKQFNADIIVRITGDCPLIDPTTTDLVIQKHLDNPGNDLTCNVIERTYPRGFDTEVLSFQCLENLHKQALDAIYREHVTNYVYAKLDRFKTDNVKFESDESCYRICVDTDTDFKLVSAIIEGLYPKNEAFEFPQILEFLRSNPELAKINAEVQQKSVFKPEAAK